MKYIFNKVVGGSYNACVRRVGIFPGTFDPVHAGHVAFARDVQQTCGLDEIIFLPEHAPRGKQQVSTIAQRTQWLKEMISAHAGLDVLQLDDKSPFTVQGTLPELKRLFPDAQLTLLVGSDVARTFLYRWDGLDELLRRMPLAIGMRGQDKAAEIKQLLRDLEQIHQLQVQFTLHRAAHADLASSQLKKR